MICISFVQADHHKNNNNNNKINIICSFFSVNASVQAHVYIVYIRCCTNAFLISNRIFLGELSFMIIGRINFCISCAVIWFFICTFFAFSGAVCGFSTKTLLRISNLQKYLRKYFLYKPNSSTLTYFKQFFEKYQRDKLHPFLDTCSLLD